MKQAKRINRCRVIPGNSSQMLEYNHEKILRKKSFSTHVLIFITNK